MSGTLLRQLAVDSTERAALCQGIQRLAGSAREFPGFVRWVEEQGPWDFVLDGANIGFFGAGKELNQVWGPIALYVYVHMCVCVCVCLCV